MTNLEEKPDGAGNELTKMNLDESHTTSVQLELDESKAHLINANGGAGDHDNLKIAIIDPTSLSSDGELSFTGLGKEEVMKYANDPFWVRLRWILFILFWVGWLAMLVTAIVIIVLAPRCPPRPDLKWYQMESVYQVFPQSFKDSNKDGVGDFNGLLEKWGYITSDLGIKSVWINNIYETDGSSQGIVDHKKIADFFGVSLDQFKSWLKKLRKEGYKVILDLIPNQTSRNHTWFQKSQQGEEPYKDYYIWADGIGTNQPPNDWKTAKGQPMWTYDSTRNQWFFHQFADLPDLNLTNPKVKEEIKSILEFWIEAGVSGFYVAGLEYLVENPDLQALDDPALSQTRNYVGTLAFLEDLRAVADIFSDKPGREKLLFGTVEYANKNQTGAYWGQDEKKRLHIVAPLWSDVRVGCNATCLKDRIDGLLPREEAQWLGIQLGNENTQRLASRLDNGGDSYLSRLSVYHALQFLLPGTSFNYYGDEFGQRNSRGINNAPMQWNTGENAGFTEPGVTPWISLDQNYEVDNVQASLAHFAKANPFSTFKELIKLRSRESFQWGKTEVCTPEKDLLVFSRKATRFPYFLSLINVGNSSLHVAPEELHCGTSEWQGKIVLHSQQKSVGETLDFKDRGVQLEPYDIVIIEFAAS